MELQGEWHICTKAQTVCRKDTVTECAMYAGLIVDFVKDLPGAG